MNFKRCSFSTFRYDEGLSDDDEEDEDDVTEKQQQNVQSRQLSDGFNPLAQIFNAISNHIMRVASSAAQKNGAQLIGFDRNEELKGDNGGDDNNDGVTENAYGNYNTVLSAGKLEIKSLVATTKLGN